MVTLNLGMEGTFLAIDSMMRIVKQVLNFNIYSPNTSSTSTTVPCNSTMCQQRRQCSSASNACPYEVKYLSNDTSSSGMLVEDVLHLTSDDSQLKMVDAHINFGYVIFLGFR